jgi:two-component system OmpR family response regulator
MNDPSGRSKPTRLLLLERDPGLRKSVKLTLEQDGLDVWDVKDERDAQAILAKKSPDVLVLDHENLAEHLGELIVLYRENCEAEEGIVLITTARRIDDSWRLRYRPDLVVYKPFDVRFLCRRIQSLTHVTPLPEGD